MPKVAFALSNISEEAAPLCYMQSTSGQTLDLTRLCTPKTSQNLAISLEDPKISITNLSYDGNLLTGEGVNNTGKMVKSVTVSYAVVDSQGQEIDAGLIKAESGNIPPGGTVSFKDMISYPGAQVRMTSLDWNY